MLRGDKKNNCCGLPDEVHTLEPGKPNTGRLPRDVKGTGKALGSIISGGFSASILGGK
jgi:hypothetical protein